LCCCFSYQLAFTNGTHNGCNEPGVANGGRKNSQRAMSVTFNDSIQMDIISSKSIIKVENPALLHSPQSHGGKIKDRRTVSIASIDAIKLRSYRLIVIFGIFFIIALFSLPIIFYYVESSSEVNVVDSCGNNTEVYICVCIRAVCIRAVCVYVLCVYVLCVYTCCVHMCCVCIRAVCVYTCCVCIRAVCVYVQCVCIRAVCVYVLCVYTCCVYTCCVCIRAVCVYVLCAYVLCVYTCSVCVYVLCVYTCCVYTCCVYVLCVYVCVCMCSVCAYRFACMCLCVYVLCMLFVYV